MKKDQHSQGDSGYGADPEKTPVTRLFVGAGRTRVKLVLGFQGRDLYLLLTGGEAHVGAVAVWDARKPDEPPVVNELPGHKEGTLAGACAEIVGRITGRTVAAVAGIHQDNATVREIETIVANAKQAAQQAAEDFRQRNGNPDAE